MKKIKMYLLIGIIYFFVQTTIEMLVIPILIHLGIPYFGMGEDDFLQVMAGVVVYFGFSKVLYLSLLYLIFFVLFSIVSKINFRFINALLSFFLYLLMALYFGRNVLTMINPLTSIIFSSIVVYHLFKYFRFLNRFEKKSALLN